RPKDCVRMTTQNRVAQESATLRDLYREIAEDTTLAEAEALGLTANEAHFAASQWSVMWRRFLRNKAAVAGGVIILVFYFVALFAGFFAPYDLQTRFTDKVYLPPQPVHLFDGGQFRPFVYDVTTEFDSNLRRIY